MSKGVTGLATDVTNTSLPRSGLIGRARAHRVFTPLRGNGLKALALRGSAWTIAGYGTGQVLRLGSNLILTRLLIPEAFGLMALVNVFMHGLQMFSDVGIGTSIIQHKRGEDPNFLNTAWALQIFRGALLGAIAFAASGPMAEFYGDRRISSILLILSVCALLQGFDSIGRYLATGRLHAHRIVGVTLGAAVIQIGVSIIIAVITGSVMSLAWGQLAGVASTVLLGHLFFDPHSHRFSLSKEHAIDVLSFGGWLALNTVAGFLAISIDRFAIPRLVSMKEFGLYSVAAMFAMLPFIMSQRLASSIMFPALARVAKDNRIERLRRALHRSRRGIMIGVSGLVCATMLSGPAFFALVYPPEYHEAWIPVLSLGPFVWLSSFKFSTDRVLLALREGRLLFTSNAVRVLGSIAGAAGGWSFAQMPGFVLGLAIGPLAGYLVCIIYLYRRDLVRVREECVILGLGAVLLSASAAGGWLLLGLVGP